MSNLADLQALYNTYRQQLSNHPPGYGPPLIQAQLNITAAHMGAANKPWTGHAQVDQISEHGWDDPFPPYIVAPREMRFNMKMMYSDQTYPDPKVPQGPLLFTSYPFNPSVIGDVSFYWESTCINFAIVLAGNFVRCADPVATADGMLYGYAPGPLNAAFAFSMRVTPGPLILPPPR